MSKNSICSKDNEIHLFIIWEKASYEKNKIIEDIKTKFAIKKIASISWSKSKFSENISRFYGENLPKNSGKERHCGTGTFTAIIVKDESPCYEIRNTSKGYKYVNINTFDKKQEYRSWVGGGHRIHATDNEDESKLHIALLFGQNYLDFVKAENNEINFNIEGDIVGSNGWNTFKELFEILNITCKYVVLRNFDELEQQISSDHPDVDLLTSDKRRVIQVLNARATNNKSYRSQYEVTVAGKKINFDLRFIGDGYYDEFWQHDILDNKVFHNDGFYIPSEVDHLYSLIYHAIVHKENIAKDYLNFFAQKKYLLKKGCKLTQEELFDSLEKFMISRRYKFEEPSDLTVFFNYSLLNKNISCRRRLRVGFLSLMKSAKKILKKFLNV